MPNYDIALKPTKHLALFNQLSLLPLRIPKGVWKFLNIIKIGPSRILSLPPMLCVSKSRLCREVYVFMWKSGKPLDEALTLASGG